MKVLVVSYLPWRDDISVGNTLSNIFQGLENQIEFANIYFRDDQPDNTIVTNYFHISEKLLAKRIFTRKNTGGEIIPQKSRKNESFSKSYNQARKMRWELMLLAQDMIGILAKWKSPQLDAFLEKFSPDIIFGPLGRVPVSNNLMTYISRKYNIPLITYPWDDHYSLKKISYSPIFWIKTFIERQAIRKCAKQSVFLYSITEQMQIEYQKYFHKKINLLYKGYDFKDRKIEKSISFPIRMIYMGNLGSGRWKIIEKVASAINEINQIGGKKFELFIYSQSPKSNEMVRKLDIGDSHLMKPVLSSELHKTMNSADILLHVEPTTPKDRSFFRLSFSTKLVDYFYNARCILAIGGDTASMHYLKDNDAAIVELDIDNIKNKLEEIINTPPIILEYSMKAWNCGMKNHQIKIIQENLYNDFRNVIKNKKR